MTTDHFLYWCYDADQELIYVGQTVWTGARFRVEQHVGSTASRWPEVVDVKVDRQCCRGCAVAAERRAIGEQRPCYNRQVLAPTAWASRCDHPVPDDVHWGIPDKYLEVDELMPGVYEPVREHLGRVIT